MSTTRVRIGPADQGRKMSLEEFREADETPGYLYELGRGVVDVVEVPDDDHEQIIHNLHQVLARYIDTHPNDVLRIAHGSGIRLLIPETESDRHPDLAVVFQNARRNARGRQIPDLVVEVVSPGRRARDRDLVEKAEDYLLLGIAESWIVDPESRQLAILQRDHHGPAWRERIFRDNDPIESPRLPGLAGSVADLWVNVENAGADATA